MKKFIIGLLASIGGFALFSTITILVLAKSTQSQQQTIGPNTVLLIEFSGNMSENTKDEGFMKFLGQKNDSLNHMVQAIDQASKDPRVKGLIARIDFASMGLAQAQELRNAIMRFRVLGRDSKKFTIAHTDTFGENSPGTLPYYLASAFEEVWLQPMGEVCLTGLYVTMPFAKDALDSLGIKARLGKREEYKNAMDGVMESSMSKASKESMQSLLSSLMNQIVRDIALSRELNEADVWDAINKGPLFGSEPLKLGLIDRLDYFDEIKPYLNNKVDGVVTFMNPMQYLASNPTAKANSGENKIALIYGEGLIARGQAGPNAIGPDIMNATAIKKAFQKAARDESVAAIVFRINSPGGSPIASETILHAIRKAQQAGKPVVVSMSDVAGSGGYWIASYADKIVAHPSTITGSIGVLGGKWVTKDAWGKLGINWDGVQMGENAAMWSFVEDYTPAGWERLQASLDNIYKSFIDRVSEGRKLPREHVMQVAKGRVWSGEEALKFGLVDKLGDLREAVEIAKELASLKDQIVPIEVFPKPHGITDQIQKILLGDDEGEETSVTDFGILNPVIGLWQLVHGIYMEVTENLHLSGSTVMNMGKIKG